MVRETYLVVHEIYRVNKTVKIVLFAKFKQCSSTSKFNSALMLNWVKFNNYYTNWLFQYYLKAEIYLVLN